MATALPRIKHFRCMLNAHGIATSPMDTLPLPGPPEATGDCLDE
jgi:hypothetical protein